MKSLSAKYTVTDGYYEMKYNWQMLEHNYLLKKPSNRNILLRY